MAHRYVRSADGDNADDGSTWALAKATAAGAAAIDASGDQINLASTHSESTAAAVTLSWAGGPTKVLSVSDAAEPPTALAAGAVIATTGANSITNDGTCYVNGITFQAGSSSNTASVIIGGAGTGVAQQYEGCKFIVNNSSTTSRVTIGSTVHVSGMRMDWTGCTVKFGNASQLILTKACRWNWNGGGLESGTTSPTVLLNIGSTGATGGKGVTALIENLDLSNGAAGMNIVGAVQGDSTCLLRNIKLPASWSGTLQSGTLETGGRVVMKNGDSGDTNYRLWVADYYGSIRDDTGVNRSGGFSDGTTPLSWKMVSNASAGFPNATLVSPEIYVWNSSLGVGKTLEIEIVHDSATALTDAEIWVSLEYLGTSGFPIGSQVTDRVSTVIATPANQTTSSVTWNGTGGFTNVNKQKLSVSFTAQEVGDVIARVHLAKASKTVYVCPKPTIS